MENERDGDCDPAPERDEEREMSVPDPDLAWDERHDFVGTADFWADWREG